MLAAAVVASSRPLGCHCGGSVSRAAASPPAATFAGPVCLPWNGTRWRHIPSQDRGDTANENELDGIAASSAADLCAVGECCPLNGTVNQTMALHRR